MLFFLCFTTVYSQDRCNRANKKLKKVDEYVLVGDLDKATDLLNKIIEICNNPNFFNSVADIYYYSMKDYDNAYAFYLKAYEQNQLVNSSVNSIFNFLKLTHQMGYYYLFKM